MTRTLFVDHTAEPGGAELALARYLESDASGDGHVLFLEDGPVVERLRDAGVAVSVPANGSSARRAIRDAVRTIAPDVAVSNSLRAGVLLSTIGPAVPHIHYLRDRVGRGDLSPAKRMLVQQVLARRIHGVIANSSSTLGTMAEYLRDQPTASVPSPSGVRVPAAGRGGLLRNGPALRILSLSRLSVWKGQHVILEALEVLRASTPGIELRLTIAGAPLFGEESYEQRLRGQCARAGIPVTFTGHVTDVAALLHSHDVLVHSSTRPEPFGQVVIQGLGAGMCVVATEGGGPSEILTSGRDGLLVRPGDAQALAAALASIHASEPFRSSLSAEGTVTAARYTDDECFGALRDAIDFIAMELSTAKSARRGR